MYVESSHAKEVSFGTFLRALWFFAAPPDRSVRNKLRKTFGTHIVCLNSETALSLLFRSIPERQPGMIVAIDSSLAKYTKKVVEKSGFKTVVFSGEAGLVQVVNDHKVSILYLSDHFNQGGRKTHRALGAYAGLVFVMQYRRKFRLLNSARSDVLLWRPRGFTRSSGGVVVTFNDRTEPIYLSVKDKNEKLTRLSRYEFMQDMFMGLFGKVQSSRHVSSRPPFAGLQLIEYRMNKELA